MASQQVDWRAIPERFRAWRELPLWRQVLWVLWRGVWVVALYVGAALAVLWYNVGPVVESVVSGYESPLTLVAVVLARPGLLAVLALIFPAVLVGVLLPHRTVWR